MKDNPISYNQSRLITFFATIGLAACFFGCAHHARAQSNTPPVTFASEGITLPQSVSPTISGGIQQIAQSALGSTNFAVALGGGRGLHGNNNLLFADYLYNFLNNGSTKAGATLGLDEIAHGNHFTTDNVNFVKGGLTVSTAIAPLKSWGLTNFFISPFASVLISTSGGQVGQIVVAGANYEIGIGGGWKFNLSGFYENRTGGSDTSLDGAYLCGAIAFSRNF
jgi:hypothetical protein